MVLPASPSPESRDQGTKPGRYRYGVLLEGRVFPRRLRAAEQTPLADSEQNRNDRLVAELRDQLPWRRSKMEDYACAEDLVRCYQDSVRVLQTCHTQLADLLREVCRQSLDVSVSDSMKGDGDEESIKAKIHERRYRDAAFPNFIIDRTLSTDLLAQPLEVAYQGLTDSLGRGCRSLAQDFFDSLDRLVDRSVIGLIQWDSPTLCRFHYFSESSNYYSRVDGVSSTHEFEDQGDNVIMTSTVVQDHVESEKRFRRRHEHQLMQAVRKSVDDPSMAIPKQVVPIISRIPEWLRCEASLIDGVQFVEQIVEQEIGEREWKRERVVKREVQTYYDPALVIDRFVLTGWGELETQHMEAEKAEAIEDDSTVAFHRQHLWASWLTSLSAGSGIALLLLTNLGGVAFAFLGIVMLAIAVGCAVVGIHNAVEYYRPAAAWSAYAFGTAGKCLAWLGLLGVLQGLWAAQLPSALVAAAVASAGALLTTRVNAMFGTKVLRKLV